MNDTNYLNHSACLSTQPSLGRALGAASLCCVAASKPWGGPGTVLPQPGGPPGPQARLPVISLTLGVTLSSISSLTLQGRPIGMIVAFKTTETSSRVAGARPGPEEAVACCHPQGRVEPEPAEGSGAARPGAQAARWVLERPPPLLLPGQCFPFSRRFRVRPSLRQPGEQGASADSRERRGTENQQTGSGSNGGSTKGQEHPGDTE